MLKQCRGCGEVKVLDEYYKHKKMADGYFNFCKNCLKERATNHRKRNVDRARVYDLQRSKEPKRLNKIARFTKKWRLENPEKYRAHTTLNNAVRDGRVTKPTECECCGSGERKIHGHHADYAKPLVVRWLCAVCHAKEHH